MTRVVADYQPIDTSFEYIADVLVSLSTGSAALPNASSTQFAFYFPETQTTLWLFGQNLGNYDSTGFPLAGTITSLVLVDGLAQLGAASFVEFSRVSEFSLPAASFRQMVTDRNASALIAALFSGDDNFEGNDAYEDYDVIYGYGGNDFIRGGIGENYVDGGEGNDTVILTAIPNTSLMSGVLLGGSGFDTLRLEVSGFEQPPPPGSGRILFLNNTNISGFERLEFGISSGSDIYFSAAQMGTAITSRMVVSGSGSNTDRLIFIIETSGQNATYSLNDLQLSTENWGTNDYFALVVGNQVQGGFNLTGSAHQDILQASTSVFASDNLFGLGGNDILVGGYGNDNLYGGEGNDMLYGGLNVAALPSGNDNLYGEGGDDQLFGDGGNDNLYGGEGNDTLLGGAGEDNLHGGAGADTLNGGADNDNLYGDAQDTFIGGDGYDTIWMTDLDTAGISVNMAAAGIERIYATNRADNLDGSGTTVGIVLYGFAGADTLIGGSGSDYIYAGHEAVQSGLVRGGAGYDYLIHDSNSLYTGTLTLNMATLQVEGVFGSARAEVINAAGLTVFATIYTGGGADVVTGSANNDVIFMDNATASVNAGAGFDYVVYNLFDGSGANFNLAAMNAEGAVGREGNDVLDASGVTTSFVTLYGYGGADTLLGGSGNDYIYMDAADLAGGAVQAGAGYDYLINQGGTALSITLVNHGAEGFFGSSAAETISAAGLTTFATIFSGGGGDTITGSAQGDTIYITNAVASVNAGAGYDYLVYELFDGSGANFNLTAMNAEGAIGRDGNDTFNASGNTTFATLYGYGGNDTMIGGSGNDAFYGGAGNDTMTGNAGSDNYVIETGSGSDTITDFTVGADRILMRVSGLTQFSQLTVVQSGADTLVSFSGQSVRLQNVTAGTITAASFQFLPAAEDISGDKEPPVSEPYSDTFDFSGLSEDTQQTAASSWISVFGTTPVSPALDFLSPEWDSQVQDVGTGNFHFDLLAFDWQINA